MQRSSSHAWRLAAAGGLLLSASLAAQAPTITVRDAWVREPMGGRNMTGAFAIVENTGPTPKAIVAASASISDTVELHEMKNEAGMMRMSPVKRLEVPAHGTLELKPGSFHVMLFDIKTRPSPGETVRLTLTFDDGTTVTTEAAVRKPGER